MKKNTSAHLSDVQTFGSCLHSANHSAHDKWARERAYTQTQFWIAINSLSVLMREVNLIHLEIRGVTCEKKIHSRNRRCGAPVRRRVELHAFYVHMFGNVYLLEKILRKAWKIHLTQLTILIIEYRKANPYDLLKFWKIILFSKWEVIFLNYYFI